MTEGGRGQICVTSFINAPLNLLPGGLLCKVAVDERLAEDFRFWDVIEALLHDVFLNLFKVFNVLPVGKFVEVDPMCFVAPEPDNFSGGGHTLVAGEEQALEDVGKVAEVEDVVKLDGCWHENLKKVKQGWLTPVS